MSRRFVPIARPMLVLATAAAWLVATAGVAAHAATSAHGRAAERMGIVPAKGHAGGFNSGTSSPDLNYHSGPVMTSGAAVTAIFWGRSWSNSSFVGDKMTGLDSFYGGIGGSNYAKTNTEYTDTTGAHVSGAVTYSGHLTDYSSAPTRAPSTTTILNEVAKEITNPVANGYYPVYVDTKRGHAGYCAWHSAGTAHGVVVQFAFFFNLDGDAGCDPVDNSGNHSQGTAALGNVSGHELSETLTDQHLNAWYDSSGSENADKCAWTFGSSLLQLGSSSWKIQGNWSNAAYDTNKGYVNVSTGAVQRGCIDGTN